MLHFPGKILMIGYGSVGRCTLPLLFKHLDISHDQVTVIDFADKKEDLHDFIAQGVQYVQMKITPANLSKVLSKYLSPGDILLDLAWNIDCVEILTWCHKHEVRYLNTSVEEWDPVKDYCEKSIAEKSLYYRQMKVLDTAAK